jgi:RNA polymerase sigma-70 factor (ECF subfamily)
MPMLARWFFEAAGRGRPPDGRAAAVVSTALRDALSRARADWPNVTVDDETYARHVGACVGDGPDPVAELERLCLVDLYLARACLDRVPGAVATFDKLYRQRVARGLRRLGPARDLDDDVWQTLCTQLFVGSAESGPRIGSYRGRSPLKYFVVVCSQRLGLNHERARRGRDRLADRLAREPPADERGPELSIIRQRFRAPFEAALRDAVAELPARDRTLLHLRLVGHASTGRLAKMFRVSEATISRRLSTVRGDVWTTVTRRLTRELGLRTDEIASLTRALASQIDIAVSVVLAPNARKKSRR